MEYVAFDLSWIDIKRLLKMPNLGYLEWIRTATSFSDVSKACTVKHGNIDRDLSAHIPNITAPKNELTTSMVGFPKCMMVNNTACTSTATTEPLIRCTDIRRKPRKNHSHANIYVIRII